MLSYEVADDELETAAGTLPSQPRLTSIANYSCGCRYC